MTPTRADREAAAQRTVRWHCSEEDSGPDVGISITLGENCELWCGEITRVLWSQLPDEDRALGNDSGWWVILYDPEPAPIAKCVSQEAAMLMMAALA